MKIALVMKDYDIHKGGAERYLVGLVSGLQKEGMQIDIIANRFYADPPEGVGKKTAKAVRWSSILAPVTFNFNVQKILKKERYDIIYGLTQIFPQDIYRLGGGIIRKWLEIKYPQKWQRTINAILPRTLIRIIIEDRIFQKGNYKKIITNSKMCKYQILQYYNVNPDNIEVIYNGVDKTLFSPTAKNLYREKIRKDAGIPIQDRVVLFSANNWKRKGLCELIEALGRLKNLEGSYRGIEISYSQQTAGDSTLVPPKAELNCGGKVWLIVLGRGNKKAYRQLAEKHKIKERVIFIGHTKEPWKYYGASDLFVLPTYYDPFSNVVLEALSCGIPVITTRQNGAKELISEGRNGHIIDIPNNIENLKKHIENILFKSDIKKMSKEAEKSAEDYSIERNIKETLEIFKRTANGQTTDAAPYLSFPVSENGILYKKNRYRSVVRAGDLFYKQHYTKQKPSWAVKEWRNIYRLKELDIPTAEPVSIIDDNNGSCLVTKSLDRALRLEDFIPEYFKGRLDGKKSARKRELIKQLALLAGRMHRRNLFHKDFYTGHIFVEDRANEFILYFLDLQRVCEHSVFTGRWRVKDLASLNYTSPAGIISNTDKLRFLKWYLGIKKIGGIHKKFIKRIIIKTKKIAEHTEKKISHRVH